MVAKIYKFFQIVKIDGKEQRKCLKCGKCLAVPDDSGTSNMINHLKTRGHEAELENYIKTEDDGIQDIRSHFVKSEKEIEAQRKNDEELVRIMVRQNASTCFFDDPDLQKRSKKAYPELKVYGRKHFTENVIPKMSEEIKQKIVDQLSRKRFSITSDGWQKPSRFPSLLSITTHVINEEFERCDNILATIVIENEHTGEEIAKLIEERLQKHDLNINSIMACVRDNASNMQKSCHLLQIESFQCAAHMYHLAATETFKSIENYEISEIVAIVRKWTASTHRSNLSKILNRHQEKENLPINRIPIDVATRWNSLFLMLESFHEMKAALLKTEDELREIEFGRKPTEMPQNTWNGLRNLAKNLPPLKREYFALIKELCSVLKIIQIETCRLSEEQATASSYLPTVKRILAGVQFLEKKVKSKEVRKFAEILVTNLKHRLVPLEINNVLRLAMMVDPRFVYDEEYLNNVEWMEFENMLIDFILKEKQIGQEIEITEEIENENAPQELDEDSMDIDNFDIWAPPKERNPSEKSTHSINAQNELKNAIKAELGLFRNNLTINRPLRTDDVFSWWRKNQENFPQLAIAAKCLLSVPATSVCSERTFSMAGLLYSNSLRNRLGGKMAEMLILIKAHLKKLQLGPAIEEEDKEEDIEIEEDEE